MSRLDAKLPAVLLVHGGRGPVGAELLAGRAVVRAVVEPDLHGPQACWQAAARVRAVVEQVRGDPKVDGERIALWFFADCGPLSDEWLRTPPLWLRCLALTDPVLDGSAGPNFRPIEAVEVVGAAAYAGIAGAMRANELPIVLTRSGAAPAGVEAFVAAAEFAAASLTVVDTPTGGQQQAIDQVLARLG